MKKFLSVLLSAIMLVSITAGIDFSAYAAYNTIGSAKGYSIGSSTTGYFTSNDTVDFIKFTLSQSGRINFVFSGSGSYDVSILSSNSSSTIWYDYPTYNSNLGSAYKESSIRLVSGTYYIKVEGYSNKNYTIKSAFTSANESFPESTTSDNNIIGRANAISLNTLYAGQLAENDKVDFYKFTVSAGTYNLYMKSTASIEYYLYTMNGNQLDYFYAYRDSNTGYAEDTDKISLNAGTYCLKVEYYSDGADYLFSISAPHQHAYSYTRTVAATYSSRGYSVYTCSCGSTYHSNYTAIKKLSKVTISKVSAQKKNHKIKVTWKKKSGASGYQIYWAKDKKFKKVVAKTIVKGGNKTSYTGKNFTKGKKYYIKVRAYKNVNGQKIYGQWSAVKTIKSK